MGDESKPPRSHRSPAGAAFAFALAALLTTHHPPLSAQDISIPVSGRPTSDFYGARGTGVRVAWSLDRTAVPLDEEIVATLVVTNVDNPRDVARPDLKTLPKFHTQFVVIDQPDAPPAAAKEVKFTYRLRPRDLAVKELPRLDFHYYNHSAAGGKQFPLTQTQKNLAITVTPPKPKAAPPVVPLRESEHLFAVARGESVLDGPPFAPCNWGWAAVGFAGPLAAVVWFLVWRRVFPDAGRLAKLRRSRAAHRATDAIHRAGRTPDPPAALANAVLGYLRSRFPLPPGAVTPTEVGAALADLDLPAAECEDVAEFLRACDEARFSPSGDNDASLTATAAAIVARLEAA
jgi:hypothetical protein